MYFMAAMLYLVLATLSSIYTILYKKSIIKGWDRKQVYTKFSNCATFTAKAKGTKDGMVIVKSDDAISLTMEGETTV